MKKYLAICLLGMSALSFAATPINGIVAVVNSGVVTQSQLNTAIKLESMKIQSAGIKLPDAAILRKQALDNLVIQTAALQMAAKNNVTVSNAKLTQTLQLIASQNHTTISGLIHQMQKFGLSEAQFKDSIKDSLIIRTLEQEAIAANIMVTPDEIDNYLARAKKMHQPGVAYNLAHILIALPANPTPQAIAKAKARANTVYQAIQKGLDFKSAAVKYSDSGDAARGGVLGFEPLSLLPTLFVKPAQTLQVGEVTKPFKSPTGFHIVTLLAKHQKQAAKHTITQYQLQKIVLKISPIMSNERAHHILENLRTAIVNGKSFATLARENSQDPISASNGGKTDWLSVSALGPAIAAEVSQLKPNELSQPIHIPGGWVLLKLLGSRQHDNTQEFEREMAANAIFQKKAMEAVNTWRAQLKGESYIKIMPTSDTDS